MPYPSSALCHCPYNAAERCDNAIHHRNDVRWENSRVCFWCLSLPYKSGVYLLVARAKNKRAYLRPRSPGKPGIPGVPPLRHGRGWRGWQQAPRVSPESPRRSWDRAEAAPRLATLQSITEQVRLPTLRGAQQKAHPAPGTGEPAALPVLALGLRLSPLPLSPRQPCSSQPHTMHREPQSKYELP